MYYLCIVMKCNIEFFVKLSVSKKINLYKFLKCINVVKIIIWYFFERGIGLLVLILYFIKVYKMCLLYDGGFFLDFILFEFFFIMVFIGLDLLFYVIIVLEKYRSCEV